MQEVIKGKKSLLKVLALVRERQPGEVLFVAGHHLLQESLFTELCAQLTIPFQIIHPPDGVLQVYNIPSFKNIGALIAIGGGKTMDYAKGILYQHPAPVLLIAAPTTAGSGSEATPIAVFYNGKEKVSLDAPQLLPSVAVLDPSLLTSLPPYQRAVSGADALAQCIESVWSMNSHAEAETFALAGMEMLWQELSIFVKKSDEAIDEKMLWAAHLAGKAITLTRTTGPHALSYYLTAHYGIPHGQAVALTLPLFFLYNDEEKSRGQLAKIYSVLQVPDAEEAFAACRQLIQQLGLATTLNDLRLQDLSLDDWLGSVNRQRFANNPVPFDDEKLKVLFQQYLC